jgi:hypothetical protein
MPLLAFSNEEATEAGDAQTPGLHTTGVHGQIQQLQALLKHLF